MLVYCYGNIICNNIILDFLIITDYLLLFQLVKQGDVENESFRAFLRKAAETDCLSGD